MTAMHDPQSLAALGNHLRYFPGVMLYIGPDQIMPLTSVIGALVGVALMFWNRLVGLAYKCWSIFTRKSEVPRDPSGR